MSSTKLVLGAVVAIAMGCGGVEAPAVDAAQSDAPPPRDVVCGSAPIEVLPNGGFDDVSPLWTQASPNPMLICEGVVIADSGTKVACLGGVDGSILTLTQEVRLPAGARQVALSGKRCISTQETATVDSDILELDLLDGSTTISAIGKLSNQQGSPDCDFSSFTLTQPVTRDPITATLRIRSTLDSQRTTTFFIDTLSLKVSCSP